MLCIKDAIYIHDLWAVFCYKNAIYKGLCGNLTVLFRVECSVNKINLPSCCLIVVFFFASMSQKHHQQALLNAPKTLLNSLRCRQTKNTTRQQESCLHTFHEYFIWWAWGACEHVGSTRLRWLLTPDGRTVDTWKTQTMNDTTQMFTGKSGKIIGVCNRIK